MPAWHSSRDCSRLSHETRRLSDGHVDGVEATWQRVDARRDEAGARNAPTAHGTPRPHGEMTAPVKAFPPSMRMPKPSPGRQSWMRPTSGRSSSGSSVVTRDWIA